MPDMRVVEAPVLAPGRCLTCHRHGGPMVDTLIRADLMEVGAVYLCQSCVAEAAGLFGFLDPASADTLRQRLAAAAETERNLRADLEGRLVERLPGAVREILNHQLEGVA